MAVWTVDELKENETGEFPIVVGGKDIIVRRPDLQLMVLNQILPTPLLNDVVKMFGEWVGKPLTDITEDVLKSKDNLLAFVDEIVCQVMVDPPMVRTAEQRDALKAEGKLALIPSDLSLGTKRTITFESITHMRAMQQEVVAAATEFHQVGSGA